MAFGTYSYHGAYYILASCYIRFTLNNCSFVHQCNTFTFYFLFSINRRHVSASRPSSIVIVCSPEAGTLLCQFVAYVRVPAMCSCWWCAYCQCPFVRIFVLSLWPPCCTSFWRVYYNTWRWPCEAETCRRLIENKKWTCYIDGQKNKYSVLGWNNSKTTYWEVRFNRPQQILLGRTTQGGRACSMHGVDERYE
jgi:hypothetical protein